MAGEAYALHTPSTAPELPADWSWKRLDAVCNLITNSPLYIYLDYRVIRLFYMVDVIGASPRVRRGIETNFYVSFNF
jgi:hypothetical protein